MNATPELIIHISSWSLLHEATLETREGIRKQLSLIRDAGFSSYCARPHWDGLGELIEEFDFNYGSLFVANREDEFEGLIRDSLQIGDGPMNCLLANHDTSVRDSISLAKALMAEAHKQGARVHLETHRDTCTETPEKTDAIIEGLRSMSSGELLINFDYSHHAVVKHLNPVDYSERLFSNHELFQSSNLWHMRPFNGHHCQLPVTNGRGDFTYEYLECREFFREGLKLWLDGPRPTNRLWVVPELGTQFGYNLSIYPNIWEDTVALANDIQSMWSELTAGI